MRKKKKTLYFKRIGVTTVSVSVFRRAEAIVGCGKRTRSYICVGVSASRKKVGRVPYAKMIIKLEFEKLRENVTMDFENHNLLLRIIILFHCR